MDYTSAFGEYAVRKMKGLTMMTTPPMQIVAVAGWFFNAEGKILFVKTGWRGWEVPGGQVELGEDLMEALVREVQEESGCQVKVDRLIGVRSNIKPSHEKIVFQFLGKYVSGIPRGNGKETLDAKLLTPDEATDLLDDGLEKDLLEEAVNFDGQVRYRVYETRPYRLKKQVVI